MDHEAAFTAAIQSEPDNDLHRLVYADWLEEQGDPCAEYLRLSVQMPDRSPDTERFVMIADSIDREWREGVGKRFDLVLSSVETGHERAVINALGRISSSRLSESLLESLPAKIRTDLLRELAVRLRSDVVHQYLNHLDRKLAKGLATAGFRLDILPTQSSDS